LGLYDEKNISTKRDKTEENPWFQGQNGHQGWPSGIKKTTFQRSQRTVCLINAAPMGLPKRARLQHSREFNAVFEQNTFRVSTPGFLILAKKNDFTYNRLGMIISKKTAPTSVRRNLVKRLIRETFRQTQLGAFDTVVLARPPVNRETKTQLRKNLSLLFAELETKVGYQ
tara:strand:+ start:2800 stop:3309 length:510 start_codon:yes stop_codon:yes gene_type:complete